MQRRKISEPLVTVCQFQVVPCKFNGVQFGGKKPIELWTPVVFVPRDADELESPQVGSTYSAASLRKSGFIPAPVCA